MKDFCLLVLLFALIASQSLAGERAERLDACRRGLAGLSGVWKTSTENLLIAETDGQSVLVRQMGTDGELRGQITDLHLVGGKPQFKINGQPYRTFYPLEVQLLKTITDPQDILRQTKIGVLSSVEALLRAQEMGTPVIIIQSGIEDEVRGLVSNVRLESDNLAFDIDGQPYPIRRPIKVSPAK